MKTELSKLQYSDKFKEAVQVLDRDVMVIANAGAGKTRLMVEHFFELLANGFEPSNILAFTFTEKAASELRERIFVGIGDHPSFKGLGEEWLNEWRQKLSEASIGTIHQFCLRVLQEGRSQNNFKPIKIIDKASEVQVRESLIRTQIKTCLESDDKNGVLLLETYGIGKFQDLLRSMVLHLASKRTPVDLDLPVEEEEEKELLKALQALSDPILSRLNHEKETRAWFTFDDLEKKALELIENPSKRLQRFISRFSHVLVDEFQDTSPIQIQIIEALRKKDRNGNSSAYLFCVGDPKQSIYRFRNVDRSLIENTQKQIISEGGCHFDFTKNYRSTPSVIEFVNAFSRGAFPDALPSNPYRENASDALSKTFSIGEEGTKLNAESFREAQADWVTQEVEKLKEAEIPLEEIAVLYRASSSTRAITQAFKTRGIPYTLRGGQELMDRQEILDLKHLLYFLANPRDKISLVGVLRSPIFLVSDLTLFYLCQGPSDQDLWKYLLKEDWRSVLEKNNPDEIPKLEWTLKVLKKLMSQARGSSAYTLLRKLMDDFGLASLMTQGASDTDTLLAIEQFLDWIREIEEENAPMPLPRVISFLKQMERTPVQKPPLGDVIGHKGSVQLLTIHASKGLEFHTVFFIDAARRPKYHYGHLQTLGTSCGLRIPLSPTENHETERYKAIKSFHEEEEANENKRLLYVTLTRAENRLLVTLNPSYNIKGSLQTLLLDCLGEKAEYFDQKISIPKTGVKISQEKGESQETPLSFLKDRAPYQAKLTCSVSELETFSVCPLKHNFAFNKDLSDKKWEEATQISNTDMGTLLHSALNILHQSPDRTASEVIREILNTHTLWLQEETAANLVSYLEGYLASRAYEKILTAEEDYSELPFLLDLENGKVRGQIDRLIKSNGSWTLIDFKFSSRNTNPKDLIKKYGFQLMTYCLATEKILEGKSPKVEIHLLESQKLSEFSFSSAELKDHEKNIKTLFDQIGKTDLNSIGFRQECHQCPYNHYVPVCKVPREESRK